LTGGEVEKIVFSAESAVPLQRKTLKKTGFLPDISFSTGDKH
jgi:hypothetical protein